MTEHRLDRFGWVAEVVGHADLTFVVKVSQEGRESFLTLVDCDVFLDGIEDGAHVPLLMPKEHPIVGDYLMTSRGLPDG